MNETVDKTAPCRAITEKKAHRPGGCVGIFFQLFDWNRRFAKKKLFSRKSLPPGAKQASKRFGGNEKMPKSKLGLIADENRGGFPKHKKNSDCGRECMETKHEMRPPSLVARLMGLESMPAVRRDKTKKATLKDGCNVENERSLNNNGVFTREDSGLEKANNVKVVESRPQKIQKTLGPRTGSEALQIKNVLSRARNHHHHHHHHHPKLASPVRSLRLSASRRTSRLIDAAARILEPGLQTSSRAKCELTYSSSMHRSPGNETVSSDLLKQCDYNVTSCKNCGSLVDVMDSRPSVEEKPFIDQSSAIDFVGGSNSEMGKNEAKPFNSILHQEERNVSGQGIRDHSGHLAAQCEDNEQQIGETCLKRKPLSPGSHEVKDKPRKDEWLSSAFKNRVEAQTRMLQRERITQEAGLRNVQRMRASSAANAVSSKTKNFVALNRSSTTLNRVRSSSKVDSFDLDTVRRSHIVRDDPISPLKTPVRKRRIASVSGQAQSPCSVGSTSVTQNLRGDLNSRSVEGARVNNRLFSQVQSGRIGGKRESNTGEKDKICRELKERRQVQNNSSHKVVASKDYLKASLVQKQLPLKGDALVAHLKQKLRELVSKEEEEMVREGTLPKRYTVMILQELISALAVEQPVARDNDTSDTETAYQSKGKRQVSCIRFAPNGDHLSPGSVLEASFSNDSCFSSSFDDSYGHRLRLESMDSSYDQLQQSEPDIDLLKDSATSFNKVMTNYRIVSDLMDHVSHMLNNMNNTGLRLMGWQLSNAKEVIVHAELLFRKTDFLICLSLLDELMILPVYLPGFTMAFLFDCMIEYLDSRYGRHVQLGLNAWRKLPLCMNADVMAREIIEEVRKWKDLARMALDEIMEFEMSHSLGRWTDFDAEAFQVGVDIDCDILRLLVDEVVVDLWQCRRGLLKF